MRRWALMVAVSGVCAAGLAVGAPSSAPEGKEGGAATTTRYHGNSGVAHLEERLESLRPDDPMAYFDLGEEVAYEMGFLAGRNLARHLFVLSFELDRKSAHPRGLGASVCLALAELSMDVNEQRWLRALAESLGGSLHDMRWSASFAVSGSDQGPLDLADAMGRAQAGDVRKLRSMLARFDVATMLRDAGMKPDDAKEFVRTLQREVDRLRAYPPSREVRRTTDGTMVVELDPVTGGNPGPSLTRDEYLEQLRVELLLLDGRPRTWAGQMLMGGGAPLRDIDPRELAPYFGVDPAKSEFRVPKGAEWRDGAWVVPGGGGEESGARGGEHGR